MSLAFGLMYILVKAETEYYNRYVHVSVCGCVFSLFPTMPRHNLIKAAPMVIEFCEKHGLVYQMKPALTAFADIVR